ncbi:MAG: trypsin-like peptidase domain-containing protein, partial [Nocardioides sp.]|nr:trypsin-like peptidase domain-containing protein [Nocardioides sp.]
PAAWPPPPHQAPPPQHRLPPQTQPLPHQTGLPGAPHHLGARREEEQRRTLPLGTWLGVAAVALVLGLVGGLSGTALLNSLDDSRPERLRPGLDSVRTQEAAPLEADNGSIAAVAEALLPSTVQILASVKDGQAGATGSGFVLDRDGHIVTNNHVVADAARDDSRIVVIDHEGRRHDATVVGRSPVYDLAVLQIDESVALETAALGDSGVLRVGDPVVALGSPLGLSQTVTSGIISAMDRPVTTGQAQDDTSYINAVQTDAAINPGNSGGPLVNLAGEVVGVNSAIATTGGGFGGEAGNIGVGFAIPVEQVRTTVDQILRTGEAQYPIIGAQVRTADNGTAPGALITDVTSGSPAAAAGLEQNDVVTHVNGQVVSDGIALIVAIRTHVPGEEIELTVVRDGDERTFVLELDGQVG